MEPAALSHKFSGVTPTLRGMLAAPHQLLAMTGGLGLSPFWPGTLGTLAGFALFFLLQPLAPGPRALAYVLLVLAASWACRRTGEDMRAADHRSIVIDETVGMSLVLEFVAPGPAMGVAAFLLFRFFDAVKPWPIHLADRAGRSGFFVMLDDLIAAAFAALVARFALQPLFA